MYFFGHGTLRVIALKFIVKKIKRKNGKTAIFMTYSSSSTISVKATGG